VFVGGNALHGSDLGRQRTGPDAAYACGAGRAAVATIHAEGAQIYECKADSGGKITWLFREPVATLLLNGKTIGRHYAGPTWELTDGSAVAGKSLKKNIVLPSCPPMLFFNLQLTMVCPN